MTKLKINLNKKKENEAINKNGISENGTVKQSAWESPRIKGLWKRALKKAKSIEDPWEKFHIAELPTENVIRHRYSALRKKWVLDECQVKMENEVSRLSLCSNHSFIFKTYGGHNSNIVDEIEYRF